METTTTTNGVEAMNATKIISTDDIKDNRNAYTFCTMPKWAKRATVDNRGNVTKWHRGSFPRVGGGMSGPDGF